MNRYTELIIAMFRTGILGYGGGPSIIPLIRYEAVTRYRWISNEEFGEVLAVANALPGPIATKLAAYVGYRQKGVLGAVVALIAHILPTSLAMVLLLSVITLLSSSKVIAGMIGAVTPVVAVMLGMMAYEFAEKAVKGLGKVVGIALFAVSFLLLQVVSVHSAIVIVLFLLYGAFHFRVLAHLQKNKKSARGESA
ncbi:chromate transporter [Paenibacillus thalictri]|uniref:Chromate transporter n=1 Tax=Paenibacillus thalictri TaxID=2527873 RepID=A0A4V6MSD1_9BACL|nr:chromate transporter [Paenibacillus thalictri]TBL70738.1 chromate transporter [Paenibacillus thalictri]